MNNNTTNQVVTDSVVTDSVVTDSQVAIEQETVSTPVQSVGGYQPESDAIEMEDDEDEVSDSEEDTLDSVDVSASEDAEPVAGEDFAHFGFAEPIAHALEKLKYTAPTPIQLRAIPVVMQGKDLLGIAQTGTGKTAAFALPILNRLVTGKYNGTQVLVLVPTRELAVQVAASFRALAGRASAQVVCVYGGQSFGLQVRELRNKPDIVVACPGRLHDHITRQTINLRNVSMLVLDEADQMFDMGFLPTVRKILRELPKERQSMLFSATMPSEIRDLTREVLTNPETVEVSRQEPAGTISHHLYGVQQDRKLDVLVHLLKKSETETALVFARTKHRTKRLADSLFKAGIPVTSLQGNLSQQQREKSMKGFRAGKFKVMVATDIASRGIDVSSIGLVVNYDLPMTTETYTHRVGRTGRALRSGVAVTLAGREDASMVRQITRRLKVQFEEQSIEGIEKLDLSGAMAVGSHMEEGERSYRGGRSGGNRGGGRGRSFGRGGSGGRSYSDRGSSSRGYGERRSGEERQYAERFGADGQRAEGADVTSASTPAGAGSVEGAAPRERSFKPRFDRDGEGRSGGARGGSRSGGGYRGGSRGRYSENAGRFGGGRNRSDRFSRGPARDAGSNAGAPDGAAPTAERNGNTMDTNPTGERSSFGGGGRFRRDGARSGGFSGGGYKSGFNRDGRGGTRNGERSYGGDRGGRFERAASSSSETGGSSSQGGYSSYRGGSSAGRSSERSGGYRGGSRDGSRDGSRGSSRGGGGFRGGKRFGDRGGSFRGGRSDGPRGGSDR